MNLIDLRPLGSVCGLERDARQHERYRRNPCSRPGGAVALMSSVGMACRTRFFGTAQDRVDDLPASNQRYSRGGMIRMHALRPGRARASGVLLHGTGTGGGMGTETADEVTRVNSHCPSIFLASPSRSTWLLAVQNGKPVAGFNDTSK